MLLLVGRLGKVQGRVKLFKMLHLLETEARLSFEEADEEQKMGFTQFAALNTCLSLGLISERAYADFLAPGYEYQLTPKGEELFSYLAKKFSAPVNKKIDAIIEKYRSKSGKYLIEYTHKKYIDQFELATIPARSKEYVAALVTIQDLMLKLGQPNENERYLMAGKLEHIKKIIETLPKKVRSKVQAGAIISATEDLINSLKQNVYSPDPLSQEIFEYIDQYADKEKIFSSIASDDFSTLREDEKKCLSLFLNQTKIPLSS